MHAKEGFLHIGTEGARRLLAVLAGIATVGFFGWWAGPTSVPVVMSPAVSSGPTPHSPEGSGGAPGSLREPVLSAALAIKMNGSLEKIAYKSLKEEKILPSESLEGGARLPGLVSPLAEPPAALLLVVAVTGVARCRKRAPGAAEEPANPSRTSRC